MNTNVDVVMDVVLIIDVTGGVTSMMRCLSENKYFFDLSLECMLVLLKCVVAILKLYNFNIFLLKSIDSAYNNCRAYIIKGTF